MPPHKYNEHTVPHFGAPSTTAKKTFDDSDDDDVAKPVERPAVSAVVQQKPTQQQRVPFGQPLRVEAPVVASSFNQNRSGMSQSFSNERRAPAAAVRPQFAAAAEVERPAAAVAAPFVPLSDINSAPPQKRAGPVDHHAAKNALPPTTKYNTVHHFGGESAAAKVKFDDSDDDDDPTVRKPAPAVSSATNVPAYANNNRLNNAAGNNFGGEAADFKRRRVEGEGVGAPSNNNNGGSFQPKQWKERKPPSAAALATVIPLPPPVLKIPTVESFVRSFLPANLLQSLLLEEGDADKALRKAAKNATRLGVWEDHSDEEIDDAERIRREERSHSDLLSTVLSLTKHTSRRCHGIIGEMNKLNNPSYVIPTDAEVEGDAAGAGLEEVKEEKTADTKENPAKSEHVGWGDLTAIGSAADAVAYKYVETPAPNMRCVFKKFNALTRANKAAVVAAVSFVEVFYPRLIMMLQLQHEYGDHYSNEMATIVANATSEGGSTANSFDGADILSKRLKPLVNPILVARLPALAKRRLELYSRYGLMGAAESAALASAGGAADKNSGNYSNDEVRSVLVLDDEDPTAADGEVIGEESVLVAALRNLFESKATQTLCKTFNMNFYLTACPIPKKKDANEEEEEGAAMKATTSTVVSSINGLARMSKKDREEARLRGEMAALMTKEDNSRITVVSYLTEGSTCVAKKSHKASNTVATYLATFTADHKSTPQGIAHIFTAKQIAIPTAAATEELDSKPLPPSQRFLMQLPVPTAVGTIFKMSGVGGDNPAEEEIKAIKKASEDALTPLVTLQQSSRKVFPRILSLF